jgi:hypothetical protein
MRQWLTQQSGRVLVETVEHRGVQLALAPACRAQADHLLTLRFARRVAERVERVAQL